MGMDLVSVGSLTVWSLVAVYALGMIGYGCEQEGSANQLSTAHVGFWTQSVRFPRQVSAMRREWPSQYVLVARLSAEELCGQLASAQHHCARPLVS